VEEMFGIGNNKRRAITEPVKHKIKAPVTSMAQPVTIGEIMQPTPKNMVHKPITLPATFWGK
jgi:hypothetical protein